MRRFVSRILKPTETRYTTTEQGALALVYCCSKFRQYIIGQPTIVLTDHHALTFLRQSRLGSGRLARWTLALQEFQLEVRHIAGKENIGADTLSRYPQDGMKGDNKKLTIASIRDVQYSPGLRKKLKELSQLQKEDPKMREKRTKSPNPHLLIQDDVLFTRNNPNERWRVAIPTSLVRPLVQETHELYGHPGKYKTFHVLRESCSFRDMNRIVGGIVKSCDICQRTKPVNFNAGGPITSHRPSKVLETVSVDLMGPLPVGRGGVRYILAMVDTFSKYTRLYALRKATTAAILRRITDEYIGEVGTPTSILTDNGTQFTAQIWKDRLERLGIHLKYATTYHPQSNPVERYNREIGRILRTYCAD